MWSSLPTTLRTALLLALTTTPLALPALQT